MECHNAEVGKITEYRKSWFLRVSEQLAMSAERVRLSPAKKPLLYYATRIFMH